MKENSLQEAVDALRAGKAAVFPTDTVYGLGVSVEHAKSPKPIYDLKKRDEGKPIAWLVNGPEALDQYGKRVPDIAKTLASIHWPGALTIIVKASDSVPMAFRSAEGTIGLRMPASETALTLIDAVGSPLATSSANVSGSTDAASAGELDAVILDGAAAVVTSEQPSGGVASTVIDCSRGGVIVLRQGAVDLKATETSHAADSEKEGDIMADQVFTVPFEFPSQDGKSTINAKMWTSTKFGASAQEASEKPKGVIQIVHGMSEYIDRYDDLAKYFVGRGFVVCAEDHIGHGKSVSDPTEYGNMPARGGKDILLGDVRTLHLMTCELYPDVPQIIYGHSMGSFITRAYIARYGDDLAACVLSGTGNVPAALSKFGRFLARMLASIKGEKYKSPFIDNMGAGAYGKQIENARTPLDWLSTDETVVDAYIADDLCGFMFTVGGYATLLDLTAEVVTPACAAKVPKDLPIFLVAGDGDPVGDMGKGVLAAAQLLRDAGVTRVDEKIYVGMRHEIHNEIGREQVYDDIASWIEKAILS